MKINILIYISVDGILSLPQMRWTHHTTHGITDSDSLEKDCQLNSQPKPMKQLKQMLPSMQKSLHRFYKKSSISIAFLWDGSHKDILVVLIDRTFFSDHSQPDNNETPQHRCVCWTLLFSLCPAVAVLTSLLSSLLVYLLCQKKGTCCMLTICMFKMWNEIVSK